MTTYIQGDGRNTNTNIAKKVLNFHVPPKLQNCIVGIACRKREKKFKEKKEKKKKKKGFKDSIIGKGGSTL